MREEDTGTVISGTHRPEDLIPALTDQLMAMGGRSIAHAFRRNVYSDVYKHLEDYGDLVAFEDQEAVGELVEALFDELAARAPEGTYFGAHPGDSSDYGFWPTEEGAFAAELLDLNAENDSGMFGYYGDLDGTRWGTFPIGFNQTQETDYVAVSNWEVLQRELVEAFPGHAQVENYKHWVGSIQVYVIRIDTTYGRIVERALELREAYENYALLDEDHASEVELRLHEEAYEDDPSLREMIREWVATYHIDALIGYGYTLEGFMERFGFRLASDAMSYYGEAYVAEDGLDSAWSDVRYEMRYEFEHAQPQLENNEED